MTLTPLTPPPTPPSRSDPPATFITRADDFVNWQSANLVPELNALLPEIVLVGSANNYGATSPTSLAVGTGSKTLTVQADKAFQVGQFVQIANTATPANYMFGQVTAYNSTTGSLTVLVSSVGGSGTFTAWTIGLAATGGAYAQLAGATFTGGVTVPNLNVDATGSMYLSGGNFLLQADTGDYWFFNRTTNYWRAFIGGAARLDITATGGKLYGDWSLEGVTYLASDSTFTLHKNAGNPVFSWDTGDLDYYDRTNNLRVIMISGVDRHVFSSTQHLINSDPVVTRASTDTLTNKTLTSPNINSAPVPTVSGAAPLYFPRAWVSFNGSGTVAINASGNVSSITDNGVGDYTVNFTTAMPDVNYAPGGWCRLDSATGNIGCGIFSPSTGTKTTSACQIKTFFAGNGGSVGHFDSPEVTFVATR